MSLNVYYIDIVDLTEVVADTDDPDIYWMKDLMLYKEDKKVLLHGCWLTDSIITAGQILLRKENQNIGGLQPTILSENFQFSIQKEEFVQILNVNNSHWLTISSIGCPKGTINVYDSLSSNGLSTRTMRVIAGILFVTDQRKITINHIDVQTQSNCSDCGVFSLAFATSLCQGEDPSIISYIAYQLRDHLYKCLENRKMLSFPRRSRQRTARSGHQTSFNIYCECRLPQYGSMITCERCEEWFHKKCVVAPNAVWKKGNTIQWFCKNCS